jgi:hypothetical protein
VKQNRDDGTRPSPRKGMSDFLKALLWTAVPLLVVSTVSAIGALTAVSGGGIGEPGIGIGGLLFGLAILVSIAFAIARKRRIAAGVLAGAAIGLAGLSVTCFTLLSKPAPAP